MSTNVRTINRDTAAIPRDLHAERCVLSLLLEVHNRHCLPEVRRYYEHGLKAILDTVKPEHFFSPAHRVIFESMMAIRRSGQPCELEAVAEDIERRGKVIDVGGIEGGEALLCRIESQDVRVHNGAGYAVRIQVAAIKRDIMQAGAEMVRLAYRQDTTLAQCMEPARRLPLELRAEPEVHGTELFA